jgi:hypothetical protein
MADDEDGFLNLSLPQKLQLGAFGAGTLIFLITYAVSGLLNGFNYVNTWILENPVPVAAYWSLQIGLIPVYRSFDPRHVKLVKQFAYKFFFTGAPFIVFWAYYQFNPPQTGIDRIVSTLSYIITSAVTIGVILSGSNFHIQQKKN